MAAEGVPELEVNRMAVPAPRLPETDRLARRDQLILRLEVARRRQRLARQLAQRLHPTRFTRLSG